MKLNLYEKILKCREIKYLACDKYSGKIFPHMGWYYLVWFVLCHGISIIVAYLMPNPLYKNRQFYKKQFTIAYLKSLDVFNSCIGSYQVLPLWASWTGSDGYKGGTLQFHEVLALPEPHHQIFLGHIHDIHWKESYSSAEMKLVYSTVDMTLNNLMLRPTVIL